MQNMRSLLAYLMLGMVLYEYRFESQPEEIPKANSIECYDEKEKIKIRRQ
jgi:hypothetical protein